jgi:hypothetical protein
MPVIDENASQSQGNNDIDAVIVENPPVLDDDEWIINKKN